MNKLFISIALLSACATADDEIVDETTQYGLSLNGLSLNGISMNGTSVNGLSLNGLSLNGISLNGTTLTGASITATSTTAPPLSGAGVVGSTWNGAAGNATSVKLRIDAATPGTAAGSDLWFYKVSYQTSSGWSPLCGVDGANQPILAVTVAGTWVAVSGDAASYTTTTNQFTFACRGKTIAKCVELGYKTFKGRTTQLTTCVRLLRGDYCGTGVPYTVDGTTLNLYDNIGVQADTQAWFPEAEWTPTGARCINKNNSARYDLAVSKDPKCVNRVKSTTCGTTFANGAILIDELP